MPLSVILVPVHRTVSLWIAFISPICLRRLSSANLLSIVTSIIFNIELNIVVSDRIPSIDRWDTEILFNLLRRPIPPPSQRLAIGFNTVVCAGRSARLTMEGHNSAMRGTSCGAGALSDAQTKVDKDGNLERIKAIDLGLSQACSCLSLISRSNARSFLEDCAATYCDTTISVRTYLPYSCGLRNTEVALDRSCCAFNCDSLSAT